MKEIVELMRAHLPSIRTKTRFVLSKISEENGKFSKREMGTVMIHKKSDLADEKTL